MASQVESIKWVPGTRFIVDGFRFLSPACRRYFLTHAHSDHTTGLTRSFDAGLIYCSPVTGALLVHDMGLSPTVVRPLELDTPAVIDGVEVTPICANHCPGAVCFLFKVPPTDPAGKPSVVLHTGDFRWCPRQHGAHPSLTSTSIDTLMLDTTYCTPKWTFPHQDEVIASMAQLLQEQAAAHPATLFVCMSYHIGKERAYFGAALRLGWKVWVAPAKRRVLRLLCLPDDWMALLTDVPEAAKIHVLGGGEQLQAQALTDRIKGTQWERVVVIRPTGWTYRKSGKLDMREEGCVVTMGVPYSEHSSFAELQDCVKTLRPKKLIPTVNAGDAAKARAIVDRLCGLMDLSEDRTRLDAYFIRRNSVVGEGAATPASGDVAERSATSGGGDVETPQNISSDLQRKSPEGSCEDAPVAERVAPIAEQPGPPPLPITTCEDAGEFFDVNGVDIAVQERLWQEIVQSRADAMKQSVTGASKRRQQSSILAYAKPG